MVPAKQLRSNPPIGSDAACKFPWHQPPPTVMVPAKQLRSNPPIGSDAACIKPRRQSPPVATFPANNLCLAPAGGQGTFKLKNIPDLIPSF
jgi:hypothetical protein